MNYLSINDLVSKEILPQINDTVADYLEDKFSYIENQEDLEDLEEYEIEEDLIEIVTSAIIDMIAEVKDDYSEELSKVDEPMDSTELYNMIESSFNDYKEIMIQRFNDEFEREEYLDEYYSEGDFDF